jgi:dsRNA-specific ribonuclease
VPPLRVPDKGLADIFESVLGAIWHLSHSHDTAHCFLAAMNVLEPMPQHVSEPHLFPGPRVPPRGNWSQLQPLVQGLQAVEERVRYSFRCPELLVEAFTHPSFSDACTPCYQRLEFLGDAVLDVIIADMMFNMFPECGPAGLSFLRQAAVNNQMLAAMARDHGLHAFILHNSPHLMADLTEWISNQQPSDDSIFVEDAPKTVSDVFESLAGAILLDGGFEAVSCVFTELMRDRILRHATPDTVNRNPRRTLSDKCKAAGLHFSCENTVRAGTVHNSSVYVAFCEISGFRFPTCTGSKKMVSIMRACSAALCSPRFQSLYEEGLNQRALSNTNGLDFS